MLSKMNARPAPRGPFSRSAVLAILLVAGCTTGGSGGCGGSCGGAFVTHLPPDGGPAVQFVGTKLDNVAQIRITQSGLSFFNKDTLNTVLANLNGGAGGAGLSSPCTDKLPKIDLCGIGITKFEGIVGDANFNGKCDPGEGAPLSVVFNKIDWGLDQDHQILRARLNANIFTEVYIRTKEAHSTLCDGDTAPIQARFYTTTRSPPRRAPTSIST